MDASDVLDAAFGMSKGWVCKGPASGLTCLPITAAEVGNVGRMASNRYVKSGKSLGE